MKRKVVVVAIIVMVLLFPFIKNKFSDFITPDKLLLVGHQINDHTYEFTKEIKEEEKIVEFENVFNEVSFSSDEWDEKTYPDIIVQINHKEGYVTHAFHIWIKGNRGIAKIWTSEKNELGRLSRSQVDTLRKIIQ